jgi:mannose-6-phosphate isomerase-like protein (cupin superfamily)
MSELSPPVSVTRTIQAPAESLFAVLAEPRRHLELDGSGMLRGTDFQGRVTGVGDVFVMRMHYDPLGDYEMNNHVVAFEDGRRIAWQPESGAGHPDAGTDHARWGHTWSFELTPDGPSSTLVRQTWDCSSAAQEEDGEPWRDSMSRTLARLDELCRAPRPEGPPEHDTGTARPVPRGTLKDAGDRGPHAPPTVALRPVNRHSPGPEQVSAPAGAARRHLGNADGLPAAATGQPNRFDELLSVTSLSVGSYRVPAAGGDDQTPHSADEVYVVMAGSGRLTVGEQTWEVRTGDVLYVPAEEAHRFHDVTADLHLVVVFAPPYEKPVAR